MRVNTKVAIALVVALVLFSSASIAGVLSSDPDHFCHTSDTYINIPRIDHCKKGDAIIVDEQWLKIYCDLMLPIHKLNKDFICIYRGDPRKARKRNYSEQEKAIQKDYFKNKYGLEMDDK